MSLIFWDYYLDLDDVYRKINKLADSNDEKNQFINLVDEIVHHQMLGCILTNLEDTHHPEFLEKFVKNPNDESMIEFLQGRIKSDVSTLFKLEVEKVRSEIKEILHI